MNLLTYDNLFIYEQLKLEERLLRTSDKNYCILNSGTKPAVVMGISSKAEEMLEPTFFKQNEIALIKRYSGGGTVVVDEKTFFVTLILNKADWKSEPFPEPLMRSLEPFIQSALPNVRLHQNDFVIGDAKCGGNAQMITKERFVHHISFLWDYDPKRMAFLKLPEKRPAYRANRMHEAFLHPLKQELSWEDLKSRFTTAAHKHFDIEKSALPKEAPHRQATTLLI